MSLVDWLKHHWWWLSVPATIALERLVAAVTDINLLGWAWPWLIRAGTLLAGWLSSPVTIPVWSVLIVLALTTLAVAWLSHQRTQLSAALATATTELEALKSPTPSELDSIQERVLFWIVKIYDSCSTGVGPTPAEVAETSGIPLSEVEAALDVLKQCQIVRRKKLKSDPIDLTAQGRAYVMQPGNKARFAQFYLN